IRNPKQEIRNKSKAGNVENPKSGRVACVLKLLFSILRLFRISCFGFRIFTCYLGSGLGLRLASQAVHALRRVRSQRPTIRRAMDPAIPTRVPVRAWLAASTTLSGEPRRR